MLECTLSALGWPVSNYLTADVEPHPMGNENMTAAPSGTFRTGDGLLNIAANKQEQFVTLCSLLGRPEPSRRTSASPNVKPASAIGQTSSCRSKKPLQPRRHRFGRKSSIKAGVPAGRVLTIPQVLDEPQVRERQIAAEFAGVAGREKPLTVVRGGFLVDGKRHCQSPRLRHWGAHGGGLRHGTRP